MKTLGMAAALALALFGHNAAQAIRVLGTPTSPPASAEPAAAAPVPKSGVVTALRTGDSRGTQVQIDGQWWLVLNGRTAVLRNGRLVGAGALTAGQTVSFLPASSTVGETALDVVYVP